MNPWEESALEHNLPNIGEPQGNDGSQELSQTNTTDPLIYPGLYSATGFDILTALTRVMTRPNPQIDLGPIDCSVALLVCDLALPDQPIVYASDPFLELTGYQSSEILGRNCRFLQAPGGIVQAGSLRQYVNQDVVKKMKMSVDQNQEVQVEVVNFKKNGQQFLNLLTIIPIQWDSDYYRYSVGFQCDELAMSGLNQGI